MARAVLSATAAPTARTLARAATVGSTPAAVLLPVLAEGAHRTGTARVGLVDLGCAAGFGLLADRVHVTYDSGRALGDPASPVRLSASVVGGVPLPSRPVPAVAARVGLDRDPVDVADPDDVRALRATASPDPARLDAEIALTAATRPVLLRGDPVALLPDALARVPADALPVVTTTWALSRFTVGRRRRFLDRLRELAAGRALAWVSVEGVGVAPEVPTLGDRPASGHSIVALTVLDGSAPRPEVLGRCWSRGRWLSWSGAG